MIPLLLLALLTAAPASAASYDPKLHWQSLDTEHFTITFHDGEEQLAREMAVDAENAYRKLSAELDAHPRRRIDIVLVDWTDSANGYATITPQNHIVIFVTAPEAGSTLGLYRDWNEAIITHELTHILHISTVEGLPRVARALLGTYISSHQIEPRWIVEGLATYMETRHTVAGRGRSPEVDMVKRTAVLEGPFPPLGNMDGFQALPPAGNLRYLFGQDFIEFIAERAGDEVWPEWVHRYGRSIPFFFHFKKSFGHLKGDPSTEDDLSFPALYRAWKDDLTARYQEQAAAIAADGLTPYTIVSRPDDSCGQPAWSADGAQIAWSCTNARTGSDIFVANLEGQDAKVLLKNKAAPSLFWRRDGGALGYTVTHTVDLYNQYDDVYLYDLHKKKLKALTSGARARDPELSPDGTKLLVVTNEAQDNQLAVLTVDGRLTPLTDRHDHTNFGSPRYSPDGKQIAVSVWQDGLRDLWLYTPEGTPWRRLTWDDALDREPAWSADGRYLYFTSDRTGVPNIFAIDRQDDHLYQVTNVVTGAFGAAPRPDGRRLAFQVFTNQGPQIAFMNLEPGRWRDLGSLPAYGQDGRTLGPPADEAPAAEPPTAAAPAAPFLFEAAPSPSAQSPVALPHPAGATTPYEPPNDDPPALARRDDLPLRPYNPIPTLLPPHLWLPSLYLTNTGSSLGLLGAAATYGTDLLNWFSYSGYLTYRTDAAFLGGGASLVLNRWRPVIGLSVSDYVTPYGDVYRSQPVPAEGGPTVPGLQSTLTRYWDHRLRVGASVSYPLSEYASLGVYYSGTSRTSLDVLPDDAYFPSLPTRGFFSTIGAGWSRSRGSSYSLSISPEAARSVALGVEVTPSLLGSYTYDDTNQRIHFNQAQATAEWREYRTAPWAHNHVFAWKLSGGATLGDHFNYGSFRLGGSFSDNGITIVPSEWRMLRGYSPASDSGEWYWLGSGEYRFPIWNIDRGVGTLPVFARFVSGAVFVDAGNAFDDASGASLSHTLVGVGAEVDVYLLYLYGAGIYARLGYGFAPRGDGIPFGSPNGAYLALGSSF